MPRTEYHTRDFGAKKPSISSNSSIFSSSFMMTVEMGLMFPAFILLHLPSRFSKIGVLFSIDFRYSLRHSSKSSFKIAGDLPKHETEITSSRRKPISFSVERNQSRWFLWKKKNLPSQGE